MCFSSQINELTEFINPLKLYEYLAVGKPIVSVPLPEVHHLSPYVYIAEPNDFSNKIRLALESDDCTKQQARRDEAQKHSWDARVCTMIQTINESFGEELF